MAIDTVKLKSPYMDEMLLQRLEERCGVLRRWVRLSTGQIEYEITTGELLASWDARISIRPMREDWVAGRRGRPIQHPSEPYVLVECSLAKAFHGQNVYGGPQRFQEACSQLVSVLEELLGLELPPASLWTVRRVDVAESYALPFAAVQEFFSYVQPIQFPRRCGSKHGDHSVYFSGRTTTVKLYHKGPEFAEHDHARLKRFYMHYRVQHCPQAKYEAANARWVGRKIGALQRLANNRLRVEVEIHAEKLDTDFGHQPQVHEIDDGYLSGLHDREVKRLLREGKSDMDTVRERHAVAERLRAVYGDSKGNRLFGVWMILAVNGESFARTRPSRATFYRNRRMLEEAGVSWTRSNIGVISIQSTLPVDFTPIRTDPRHCCGQVRSNRPALFLKRGFLKLAA